MNIPAPVPAAFTAARTLKPQGGTWYRAIPPSFLPAALSTTYTATVSSRFSDGSLLTPSFPMLYLAETNMLALFEVGALFGSPMMPGGLVPHPRRATTILNVNVTLHNVVDLTDLTQQAVFNTNAQELTGDWRGYKLRGSATSVTVPVGRAPTQELGAALHAVPGLEGFVTVSAKLPEQKVLVIFPNKLQSGSLVEHEDATGKKYPLTS
jgi:hypothetical protein